MANGIKQVQPLWKSKVKRVLMGLLWVYLIWLTTRIICGFLLFIVIFSHNSSATVAGQIDARAASLTFMQHYGLLIFIGSFIVAVVGTLKGILPGTKGINKGKSVPEVSSEGSWPPPPNLPAE